MAYAYGKLDELKIDGFNSPLNEEYDISHLTLNITLRIYR